MYSMDLIDDITKEILEPIEIYGDEKEQYTNELDYNSIDEFSIGLFNEIY